jgi:acyl-lipid omega-6 desaturase (Delta-12 desaturase)
VAPASDSLPEDTTDLRESARQWARMVRRHNAPQRLRSVWQLVNTIIPLVVIWGLMMMAVDGAYWVTLLLSVPAAAFTVRLFILQHDCAHHAFFQSRRLNDWIGAVIGVITLTPHEYWRRSHNAHHATCGNLQKRGIGDVSVLTVAEYDALSARQRLAYRFYRNPWTILVIGPIFLFVFKHRLPMDMIRRHPDLLKSVMASNLGLAVLIVVLGSAFGYLNLLMVQAPIVFLSSAAGVWLFYVQHQFETTYWQNENEWDFFEASVMASSYYDLPQPLRWFSGDIGIHHIHHLSCRIPNYRLAECLAEIPALKAINRLSLRASLSCLRLALWDEGTQRLISFGNWRQRDVGAAGAAAQG